MKASSMVVVLLLALAVVLASISTAGASERSGCRSCRYSFVSVPDFRSMPELFTLNTPDGPLAFQVDQIIPVGATHHKYWCVCLDADGHSGPNPEPQNRSCHGYSTEYPSGGPEQSFAETPYCQWTGSPNEDSHCGGTESQCPML